MWTKIKDFFPYEYFDDYEKLLETKLPAYESFYSSLKGCNVLGEGQEKYIFLQNIWRDNNMKTLRDFLIWYLLGDIIPFSKAVTNLQNFYFEREIDVFKGFFSLPGISRKLLFDSTDANFALFDEKNKDISISMKKSLFGGPSIIFNRWAKAGVTPMKNNPDNICKQIIGLDLNALYLGALGLFPNPTGQFIVRRESSGFIPEVSTKYIVMYAWMDYISKQNGRKILHKLNCGREKRVGRFLSDGYDPITNTLYMYHGCWYHGHDPKICPLTTKVTNKKWLKRQKHIYQRTLDISNYMKKQGYNVEEIFECKFQETLGSKITPFTDAYLPKYYQKNKRGLSQFKIAKDVLNKELFGFVSCDIRCQSGNSWANGMIDKNSNGDRILTGAPPDQSLTPDQYFENFAPIFSTSNVKPTDIGDTMLQHMEKFNIPMKSRRLLVGGLSAKRIFISTSLLYWYLSHGVVLEKTYEVVEYTSRVCFKEFQESIYNARLQGLQKEKNGAVLAKTMKLIGKSYKYICY